MDGIAQYIGGICGKNNHIITSCYNTGMVIGGEGDDSLSKSFGIGGVCGYNGAIITYCYNTGAVTSKKNEVGGVCGNNYNTITNCYSTGTVIGNSENSLSEEIKVGGICGVSQGMPGGALETTASITNCYYNKDIYSGDGVGKGADSTTGLTTNDMTGFSDDGINRANNKMSGLGRFNDADSAVWETKADEVLEDDVLKSFYYPQLKVFNTEDVKTNVVAYYDYNLSNAQYPIWIKCVLIENIADLKAFSDAVNGGNTGLNAILMNDIKFTDEDIIDAKSGTNFTAIGSKSNNFAGFFDGRGHVIKNLVINKPSEDYQGLFGFLGSSGGVKNVGLEGGSVTGSNYVGGVSGISYTTIDNCYNTGVVSGISYVGGVCGEGTATIDNCYNTGVVSGTSYVGGVCGRNSTAINNSYNTGAVSGTSYVGGVCGYNNSTISNSYYDKQMCPLTFGIGATANDGTGGNSTGAEGKLTSEMTGSQIVSYTTILVTADNMYPRLKGMETSDAAIVAATPIFLTNEETVNEIKSNFSVGIGNGVTWSSKENMVSINDDAVSLVKNGNDTLICTLGSVTKRIAITVKSKPIISELETPEAVMHGDTLKPTTPTVSYFSETATGTWQLSATNDFATIINFASSTAVTYSQNGYYLRYQATNDVGTSYSDTVQITVNKKEVTITGITAEDKVYDGNATATATGTAVLNGILDGDDVTITEGTASFTDENVGTDKTVTFSDYTLIGTDAGNYSLIPLTSMASITAKDVTITGINASDKVYDGTTTATLVYKNVSITGTIGEETLTVSATGTFADKNAGENKTVTISDITLADGTGLAANYILASEGQQTETEASISKATPEITWTAPEAITEDEALSEKQLNAEANVDGTFAYDPAKGTKLKAGTRTLTATFTPKDTNYTTVDKSIKITVEAVENININVASQSKYTVYPTLVSTGFYMDLGTESRIVVIYDFSGKQKQIVNVSGKQFIDISGYAQGSYIVKTSGKAWKITKR